MADEVKLAVLEQKFTEFANIVNRLDDAIDKLSEVSSNVVKMLAVHDERIEQTIKTNDVLFKLVEERKKDNEKHYEKTNERIENLESKVEEVKKFKWMVVGMGVLIATASSFFGSFLDNALTQNNPQVKMEHTIVAPQNGSN
jgi:predicted RNase H-like nuclease (RuvC/YqgF family)